MQAVCFLCRDGNRACAAQHIDPVWNGFEMGRIYTMTDAAQVVEFEAVRDGADEQFVSNGVHQFVLAVKADRSVPPQPRMQRASPEPMRWCFVDSCPEACDGLTLAPVKEATSCAVTDGSTLVPRERGAALLTGKVEGHRGYLRGVMAGGR